MVSVGNAQIILNGEDGEEIYPLDLHRIFYKVQRVALLFLSLTQLSTSPCFCASLASPTLLSGNAVGVCLGTDMLSYGWG